MKKARNIFGILTIFILVSMFGYSANAANIDSKAIEKLVKATETQAASISKPLDISKPEEIRVIPAKAIEDLSNSIKLAKANIKSYKGNSKKSFELRIAASENTLLKGKVFNNTITKGTNLVKAFSLFQASFQADPLSAEQAFNDLVKKNDQFTKDKKKLINAAVIGAFSMKYQQSVVKEMNPFSIFYDTNKRIENFISFTLNNDDNMVWNEIFSIDYSIQKSILNKDNSKLLADKWHDMYESEFIAPEKARIEKLFQDYDTAYKNRDAKAVASLFYFDTESEKNDFINRLEETFATLQDIGSKLPITLDIRFVYQNTAILFTSEGATIEADDSQQDPAIILVKINDKWLFLDSGE